MKKIYPKTDKERNAILNEIALMRLSNNQHIIRYYESYDYDGHFWIIVELMKASLTDLVLDRFSTIPESFIAHMVQQILIGLEHVHSNHRIHRDLKSDNILISPDGILKLGDFGYAAQLTTD